MRDINAKQYGTRADTQPTHPLLFPALGTYSLKKGTTTQEGAVEDRVISDTDRLTVGAMAHLNCVSTRTLRMYDEKGLLKPVTRDDETGYRYYSLRQCETLDTIQLLQHLGFSLEEIQDVLIRRDVPQLYEQLCAKESVLDRQLGELKRLKYLLNRLKNRCLTAQSDLELEVCRVEALPQRRAVCYELAQENCVREGDGTSAEQLQRWQIAICEVKRSLIDSGVPSSYFGNVACCVAREDLLEGRIHYTKAIVFVDNRDIDVNVPTLTVPAGLYMTMYCDDRSSCDSELMETRCLHRMLEHIRSKGYEIAGDYIGEVVLDTELFSYSGRDELVKLQIPIRTTPDSRPSFQS